MSSQVALIKDTGKNKSEMQVTEFWGGDKNGTMLQVTQGASSGFDEPGFIQLTTYDAYQLIQELTRFVQRTSERKAKKIEAEIAEIAEYKNTIFQEAVACERFIQDIEILAVPLRLLATTNIKGESK